MMQMEIDLTAIRERLGITQAELARRAGVDLSTVWRWENQGVPTRGPARAFLEGLAREADATKGAAA